MKFIFMHYDTIAIIVNEKGKKSAYSLSNFE